MRRLWFVLVLLGLGCERDVPIGTRPGTRDSGGMSADGAGDADGLGGDAAVIDADLDGSAGDASDGGGDGGAPSDAGDGGAPGDGGALGDGAAGPFLDRTARPVATAAGGGEGPSLASAADRFVMAWSDLRTGVGDIFVRSFDPAGAVLGSELRLTQTPGSSAMPAIAAGPSGYGLIWQEQRQMMFAALNAGTSVTVAPVGVGGPAGKDPQIAWSGRDWVVTWLAERNNANDFGHSIFSAHVDLTGHVSLLRDLNGAGFPASPLDTPRLAAVGSDVWFVWSEASALSLRRETTAGGALGLSAIASGTAPRNPDLAASSTVTAVIWQDEAPAGAGLYFAFLSTAGDLLLGPRRLGSTSSTARDPRIVWDGARFAVAWADDATGDLYTAELGKDATVSAVRRATDQAGLAWGPALAASGSAVGLAWVDSSARRPRPLFALLDGPAQSAPPCVPNERRSCSASGLCPIGEQLCDPTGTWGACSGQLPPSEERCDGLDNDCDGRIDNLLVRPTPDVELSAPDSPSDLRFVWNGTGFLALYAAQQPTQPGLETVILEPDGSVRAPRQVQPLSTWEHAASISVASEPNQTSVFMALGGTTGFEAFVLDAAGARSRGGTVPSLAVNNVHDTLSGVDGLALDWVWIEESIPRQLRHGRSGKNSWTLASDNNNFSLSNLLYDGDEHLLVYSLQGADTVVRLSSYLTRGIAPFVTLVPSMANAGREPASRPTAIFNGAELALSWYDGTLWFQRFSRRGQPLDLPQRVDGPIDGQVRTALVWTGREYVLAYVPRGGAAVNLATLDPQGHLIGAPYAAVTAAADPTNVQLVWNGGELGLAWLDRRAGAHRPYFARGRFGSCGAGL